VVVVVVLVVVLVQFALQGVSAVSQSSWGDQLGGQQGQEFRQGLVCLIHVLPLAFQRHLPLLQGL
jgi:hypothetical protein